MFKAETFIIYSDKDNWENGCAADGRGEFLDIEFKAETLEGLLDALADYFPCDKKDFELNACEEVGRVDICWDSLKAGSTNKPSAKTLERWKAGEINLYYNCASCIVSETKIVNFN